MEREFESQVALVTGSGRGIGRAIALELAGRGAGIVVNFFRNRKPAEEAAGMIQALGSRALVVKADVSQADDQEHLFERIDAEFGRLDILVHNAASGYNRPALQQKLRGWDWTMNINARALLFLAQKAAPRMQKQNGGRIVAITSQGSQRVLPDYIAVGASKAALESLVRYLAVELAGSGIAVNAVSPGLVLTEALQHFNSLSDGGLIEEAVRATPAGRLVTPQDVAGVVAFLCSPAAGMIRGQVITVDGGYTLPAPGLPVNRSE